MDLSKRSSMSEDDELQEVEKDPTGRYVRYSKVLGVGAFKTVYKAFDEDEGIEVAWNRVRLSDDIFNSKDMLRRLCSEADLLKSLKHENIIRCYHSWVDYQHRTINMITELFTSGDLRQYRKKHCHLGVDNKAIKNWARQILKGLHYLHSHNPPIIHRDIKCENIFVNGNSGKVKIGDLGLATVLEHATAHTMIGTPEFMAPEMYDEDYNQLVDVYAFGMCMLQMLTCEIPYSECQNPAQIYKKVTSGKKPAVLSKVTDPQVRQFIEKCLCPVSERLSVIELLQDPFLLTSESSTPRCIPSLTEPITPKSAIKIPKAIISESKTLKLEGKRKENDSISMTLWISKLGVRAEKVEFLFSLQTDTSVGIAAEMERDLGLSSKDALLVAELIEEFIAEVVPGYCKCNLAEAKSSTTETISSRDQDYRSRIIVPVIGGKEAPKVVAGEFRPAASLVEHSVLSKEEPRNSSALQDHTSLFTSTSARDSDCCKPSENTKHEQYANRYKLCRGNKNSRKKVGLSSFLKSLLFHCEKP